jgi:two-component sensor histidine kinase
MVLHELATNAVKHGALSNDAAGKVDIAWQVEPAPQGDRMRLR